jgi:threonine synthase
MKFYSTKDKSLRVSLKEAVLTGMPPDHGLYMPETVPTLTPEFLKRVPDLSFHDLAFELARVFVDEEISDEKLKDLVNDAFPFDAPLVPVSDHIYALELFHGPTLAFKDFGARFMSRLMALFIQNFSKELKILVATSGDTGSAVASGFYNVPGIRVYVLYPAGKVSEIQEKQMATLGKNVIALKVHGVFDDCQSLVKKALADEKLRKSFVISSANSINIARLIPQIFYYFYAWGQLDEKERKHCVVSVPSGNFGNLTAGLLAKRMGLPIRRFVDAANVNDVVPEYLNTARFNPRPSVQTISSAMDVGNPSNFERILDLYGYSHQAITRDIWGKGYSDEQIKYKIRETMEKTGYLCDPHGAVGLLGLEEYLNFEKKPVTGIFLETAHPAKFKPIVENVIGKEIPMPERLSECLEKPLLSVPLKNDYKAFVRVVTSDE